MEQLLDETGFEDTKSIVTMGFGARDRSEVLAGFVHTALFIATIIYNGYIILQAIKNMRLFTENTVCSDTNMSIHHLVS